MTGKKHFGIGALAAVLAALAFSSCAASETAENTGEIQNFQFYDDIPAQPTVTVSESVVTDMENSENELFLIIKNTKISAKLEDNSSAQALAEKLAEGDITVEAHDYGNFEKVGELGFSLPTNDEQMTTESGDIILYQGDKLTVYYDENSWSFTKLGHIDMPQNELKALLGDGDVSITLSLN